MSGTVAVNDKGDVVLFQGDQWRPAQIAQDDKGNRLFFDGNAWSPVPGAPRPEASAMATERAGRTDAQLEGDAGRQIGLGTRATLSGLGALPGMALDAVTYPGRALARGLGMTARAPSDMGGDLMDAAGLPRAVTPRERLVSAGVSGAAGVVPTIAAGGLPGVPNVVAQALTTAPVSQAIGGATGGLASEVAAQNNGGPVAQTLAGLAGGVAGATATSAIPAAGRAAGALVQPLTPRGREGLVAEALLRQSSAPEQLAGRIASGVDTPGLRLPESPVTTAQAARDPALLATERSIRDGALGPIPAGTLREADAARNASRVAEILAGQDGATPIARGQSIRAGLEASEPAMRARVDQAFNLARNMETGAYPTQPVIDAANSATRIFSEEVAGGGVPAALQSVLDDIARRGAISVDEAQNLRSRLGQVIGDNPNDNRIRSAAGAVQQALEQVVDNPRWMAAVDRRREMGQALGRDEGGAAATGRILNTDRFGAPMMPDTQVARASIADPQSARQVLEAMYKAIDAARTARRPIEEIDALRQQMKQARAAMRGEFMEQMFNASRTATDTMRTSGNLEPTLSPAMFRRFFQNNAPVAREIFDPGQIQQLERLAADFTETGATVAAGTSRNSQTMQNMSVANAISRATNGLLEPNSPLNQQIFGGAGVIARALYQQPEIVVREMLAQAMADPNFAQMLLSRASPEAMRRAVGYVEQNLAERLLQAAGGAAVRQGVRSAADSPEAELPPVIVEGRRP